MSRTYMIRIDGKLRSYIDKDELYAIIHRYVPRSQQWHYWFHSDIEFTVILEVGCGGGDHIEDKLNNYFVDKLNVDSIKDWEITIFDLHPDNIFGNIKK